ncbi:hypothetical protein DITRI_Ditri04bG0097100 [Diplodiscus trichospermus]
MNVDMVIVPTTTRQMGVLPEHVPTIVELKPGILLVHEGNDVTKYFLSSGFAFIHANFVADIIVVEVVPIDCIDPALVQKGLSEFTDRPPIVLTYARRKKGGGKAAHPSKLV